MSDYQPGTVAVASVYGQEGVRVSRYDGGWARLDDPDHFYNDNRDDPPVTDVRPLVVLDLANNAHAVTALRDTLPCDERDRDAQDWLVSQIADAIEEQTKPPRIPEPTDPSARVKTGYVEWARVGPWWVSADLGELPRDWDYLADRDPEVLS